MATESGTYHNSLWGMLRLQYTHIVHHKNTEDINVCLENYSKITSISQIYMCIIC